MPILFLAFAAPSSALPKKPEETKLWPKGKIPNFQERQTKDGEPRLQWYPTPKEINPGKACVVFVSGGGYDCRCDMPTIDPVAARLTELGYQCVNLAYRIPRPEGLPYYQSALEDAQRAVRIIRSEAAQRGYDPENIGFIGFSAGAMISVLMGLNSQTPAYSPVDEIDKTPCHINWAVPIYIGYALTDGIGCPNARDGFAPDVSLNPIFKFDERSCPMCFLHGGADIYSPNGSAELYRALRKMKIPTELHIFAERGHGFMGKWGTPACEGAGYDTWFSRIEEFLRQMNIDGRLGEEEDLMKRFPDDSARGEYKKENVWPSGAMPDVQANQEFEPYIEWHFPKELKTKAVQIIFAGGGYRFNYPDGFEVAPVRRYLNAKGMTVVTLKYRTPRPQGGLSKHVIAWQDLQRTVRLVKKGAQERGLDPERIGLMGSSAGGHLTLMGVLNSLSHSYNPIDEIDEIPCSVSLGVVLYPAYCLTDRPDTNYSGDGNGDGVRIVEEFAFDKASAPMLFLHGDADKWSAMNSVKLWQYLRRMGIQSELHTFATRNHCFQAKAAPGTGSYNFMDRIWEFMNQKGFNK